ncbi:hypothetical protein [Pukyongiella litopenaei]|uniref:Uncharacterized protein n=1 Tax=Pukyongiella litopenaei TaxID=2605946 RepID=A0A2S0MNQ1_9RHOB|nr:hypothetical protein [Pukyongiella litopenaei]AVO37371.2 hypothetical protein C6Y53_06370 [Pukyongiella litopenaei]
MNGAPQSPVVIYVNGSPYGQSAPAAGGQSFGETSGENSGPKSRFDPYKVAREFPLRWQAYIRASYRSVGHVVQVFQVTEKTARNWWNGVTGANGAHVAIAVNEHPEQAPLMLFAAE